jgi:hypothetical protein
MATSKTGSKPSGETFPPEVWKEARRLARMEVRRRIDLPAVMREAGQVFRLPRGVREARAGVRVFSPLRDDGKSPGLLLCGESDGGRRGRIVGAKDMSTGETWNLEAFAGALWGLDWKATRERLYQLARVSTEDYLPSVASGKPVPRRKPKSTRAEWRKRREAARMAGEARGRRVMEEPAKLPPLHPAPACVADRWKEGRQAGTKARLRDLADSRGWPLAWVRWLFEAGELSWPLLPWRDDRRGIAFRVRLPCFDSGRVQTVGYHQRAANGGGGARKLGLLARILPLPERCARPSRAP